MSPKHKTKKQTGKEMKDPNDILFDYLMEIQQPFTLNQLFKTTGLKKTGKAKQEIYNLIHSVDDFVEDNHRFHPKSTFLKNIPIRIQPTEYEIEKKILIPGHRLLPFYHLGIQPGDISITTMGKPVKTKVIALKMSELLIYFNLMDLLKVPILNLDALMEENADMEIEVCDMKKFYKTHAFTCGDTIILNVVDFKEGIFSITYDSQEAFQSRLPEIEKLDRLFMTTLKKVMEKELFSPNVEKQLLYTYFYLTKLHEDKVEWKLPGTALGPLLGKNKEICFSPLANGRTRFHFAHQSVEDLEEYPDFEELNEEAEEAEMDLDSIDGILRFLNNNNDSTTVRALIFNQLPGKGDLNYREIEDYLFDSLEKPYMPPALQKKFETLVTEEYRELKNSFDLKYAYLPITTARRKILEQSLVISRFLRSLDAEMVELEALPKKEMMYLMEIDRSFVEVLLDLEAFQLEGVEEVSEVHSILKIIRKLETDLPILLETIRKKLGD
jgi:hypothetical protein